jgi:hypothetical protein
VQLPDQDFGVGANHTDEPYKAAEEGAQNSDDEFKDCE